MAEGRVSVPAWIDRDTVDGLLGAHTEGSPRLVATDGGVVAGAEMDDVPDERPADCECTGHDAERTACWPCYAAGFAFDDRNPDAGG